MPATIQTAVAYMVHSLVSHSDAPHLDAERIMLSVIGQQNASYLLAHASDEIDAATLRQIQHMTALRASGMPLAYILGEADFYGRTFAVTPDTLIPRPETEHLIEEALAYVRKHLAGRDTIAIADIGTGSGVIAITLAIELSGSLPANISLIATDISPKALEIAERNAKIHGVADKIAFLAGDMLHPLQDRRLDLIVSNPPYVPTEELKRARGAMQTRGLLFEPRIALDGGTDGLVFVNQIKEAGIPAIVETIGGEIVSFAQEKRGA